MARVKMSWIDKQFHRIGERVRLGKVYVAHFHKHTDQGEKNAWAGRFHKVRDANKGIEKELMSKVSAEQWVAYFDGKKPTGDVTVGQFIRAIEKFGKENESLWKADQKDWTALAKLGFAMRVLDNYDGRFPFLNQSHARSYLDSVIDAGENLKGGE